MSIKRYGKSSSALLNQKKSFFKDNEVHLAKQQKVARVYIKQPQRNNCKNCNNVLQEATDFVKDGIGYIICERCDHLNGRHEDTTEFCKTLYTKAKGKEYAHNYNSIDKESYEYRTTSIYLPKAEFLITSLKTCDENPYELNFLDFGSGSGYFVSALKKMGLKNVKGTEVSIHQTSFGNEMIGEELLHTHNIDETLETIRNSSSEVLSMIGVLEHVQNPREVLNEIRNNKKINYLYISVPTFSLSVFLEQTAPDIFHRQLHGGHTHLYTKKSLEFLAAEFGFNIMAEWWFGADIVDLFRQVTITLEKTDASTKTKDKFNKEFIPIIDALQLELDKKQFSSEVHMLFKKNMDNVN